MIDLDDPGQADRFAQLVGSARSLLESSDAGYLDDRGPSHQVLAQRFPHLVRARMTAFGDTGPWSGFKGWSDLVHLALGGPMMNCGYAPNPTGTTICRRSPRSCGNRLVIAGGMAVPAMWGPAGPALKPRCGLVGVSSHLGAVSLCQLC